METLIIEYNSNDKTAKEFVAFLKKSGLFKVRSLKSNEVYSKSFVKKIKKSESQIKEGKLTKIAPEDLWKSL